jgi:hypothetical protein
MAVWEMWLYGAIWWVEIALQAALADARASSHQQIRHTIPVPVPRDGLRAAGATSGGFFLRTECIILISSNGKHSAMIFWSFEPWLLTVFYHLLYFWHDTTA